MCGLNTWLCYVYIHFSFTPAPCLSPPAAFTWPGQLRMAWLGPGMAKECFGKAWLGQVWPRLAAPYLFGLCQFCLHFCRHGCVITPQNRALVGVARAGRCSGHARPAVDGMEHSIPHKEYAAWG